MLQAAVPAPTHLPHNVLTPDLLKLTRNLWLLCPSFCLKGEVLDGKTPVVIDYTPYLKFTQR